MSYAVRTTTLCCALSMILAGSALAQTSSNDPWTQIDAAAQEAITAFDGYSFRRGGRKLIAALDIAREYKLLGQKRIAPIYGLRAIGVVAGGDDLYRGLHYMTKALRLDPQVSLPEKLLTPQILQVVNSARQALKAIGDKPPQIRLALHREKVETKLDTIRKDQRGLVHETVDEARRGYPIPVKAAAGVDIRASRFYLYFRAAGKVKYERVEMKQSRGAFRAAIPPSVSKGRYVHYYIEARDQRDRRAASHGSERSPNVVIMK